MLTLSPDPNSSRPALHTVHASVVRQLPLAQHQALARVVQTDVLGLAPGQDARAVGSVTHRRETLAYAGFLREVCW